MEQIVERLKELSDLKYKEFNQKLCPDSNYTFLGIRIPVLREFAKKLLKEDEVLCRNFILNKNVIYFEEVMLQGLLIGYLKCDIKEKEKLISQYISRVDSWALTDSFVPTLKIKNKDLEEYWGYILKYINSDKEFEVRFSVVSMLDYYITDEYVEKVISILDNIRHDGYYVKMAVAWTLAEIGIKYNEKALKYFKGNNNLDKFTFNKALQKMIESYRIDNKQKDYLRVMKRK